MLQALNAFSALSVDDIEKAREFYVDTLGLALQDDSMGLHFTLPRDTQLFIYERPDHQPATYTALNFIVASIDETIESLRSLGISFEHYDNLPAPQDDKEILRGKAVGQGPDIAWFKDPAGNILAIIED